MIIEIKKATCSHCGSGRKTINIESFKKDFITITDKIKNDVWIAKCCWLCEKKPETGEIWALSINPPEKNRIWCPACAGLIEEKLKNEI